MEPARSQKLPGAVRRRRMLTLIEERGFMRVSDLAKIFGISEVTVRSDLDHPDGATRIQRVHGGAMPLEPLRPIEQTFEEAEETAADEKAAIGAAAAALVAPGESLVIDVGTTTTAVARALARRHELTDVVVFTNSLTIAAELEPTIPRFAVFLTGGQLRPNRHSLVQPMAGLLLEQVNATTAIIGCSGVHPEAGLTNINLPEAAIKTLMIKAAQRVVVVAEGPKLGKVSVAHFATVDEVDELITGPSAPPEFVAQIRELGIVVTVAEQPRQSD